MGAFQLVSTSSSLKVFPAPVMVNHTCVPVLPVVLQNPASAQPTAGIHHTTVRGARSHNGFASAAHEETAQGWCPCCCMNSAWIISPTWADLWRCWNASFQYKKVLSLYSARMEGIWHLTTSHNNRALCLSHVFPFLDVDAKPKFTWPNKDVYSAGVCIWTGHVSLSLQLMEKTRFFYWAHAINTYLKEVKRTRCF